MTGGAGGAGGGAAGHVDNSGTSSLGVSEFNQYFINGYHKKYAGLGSTLV